MPLYNTSNDCPKYFGLNAVLPIYVNSASARKKLANMSGLASAVVIVLNFNIPPWKLT